MDSFINVFVRAAGQHSRRQIRNRIAALEDVARANGDRENNPLIREMTAEEVTEMAMISRTYRIPTPIEREPQTLKSLVKEALKKNILLCPHLLPKSISKLRDKQVCVEDMQCLGLACGWWVRCGREIQQATKANSVTDLLEEEKSAEQEAKRQDAERLAGVRRIEMPVREGEETGRLQDGDQVDIARLTPADVGRWVTYHGVNTERHMQKKAGNDPGPEHGRIKSWGEHAVFVVYKCNDLWDQYQNFTGCATAPEDLTMGY